MNKIAITRAAWAALVVGFSISACGGRTSENRDDGADPSDPNATPVPTCSEICRNAIDQCLPGAKADKCASECEAMRSRFQGCPGLEPFLRCMPKVPVICSPPDKIEFNGCNDERDDLSRCGA